MKNKKFVFDEKEWIERNRNRSFPKLQNRVFHIPSEGEEFAKDEMRIDDEKFEEEERARAFREYVKYTEERKEAKRERRQQAKKQKRKKKIDSWQKKSFLTKEQEKKKRELAKSGVIIFERGFVNPDPSFYGGRRRSLEWNDEVARG